MYLEIYCVSGLQLELRSLIYQAGAYTFCRDIHILCPYPWGLELTTGTELKPSGLYRKISADTPKLID